MLPSLTMNTTNAKGTEPEIDAAILRVRRGESNAFESVVVRFEGPLRSWLAVQSPPGVDVDEIAQRSFIAAYSRLEDYQPGTDFAAWLFTIARYQLRTETTRLRRLADYHTRYAPDLLQKELNRREAELPELQQERMEHLKKCLDSLGDHVRCFITWRYDEGIPLEQMAERTGRSVAAIKKQLWQLRRKLQRCVELRMASEVEN